MKWCGLVVGLVACLGFSGVAWSVPYFGVWADQVFRSNNTLNNPNFARPPPDGNYASNLRINAGMTVTFGTGLLTSIDLPTQFDPRVRAIVFADASPDRFDSTNDLAVGPQELNAPCALARDISGIPMLLLEQ